MTKSGARRISAALGAVVVVFLLTSCIGPSVEIPPGSNDLPKCIDDGTSLKAVDLITMTSPVACDPSGIALEFPDGFVMPITAIGTESSTTPFSDAVCPHYAPRYTIDNDGTLGIAAHKLEKHPYRVQWWGTKVAVKAEQDAFGAQPPYNDGCVQELDPTAIPSK